MPQRGPEDGLVGQRIFRPVGQGRELAPGGVHRKRGVAHRRAGSGGRGRERFFRLGRMQRVLVGRLQAREFVGAQGQRGGEGEHGLGADVGQVLHAKNLRE